MSACWVVLGCPMQKNATQVAAKTGTSLWKQVALPVRMMGSGIAALANASAAAAAAASTAASAAASPATVDTTAGASTAGGGNSGVLSPTGLGLLAAVMSGKRGMTVGATPPLPATGDTPLSPKPESDVSELASRTLSPTPAPAPVPAPPTVQPLDLAKVRCLLCGSPGDGL